MAQTVEAALMVRVSANTDGAAKRAINPAAKRHMTVTCVGSHHKGFAMLRKDNVYAVLVSEV